MLSHCANAQCGKQFLRLGEGKLFLVETEYGAGERAVLALPAPRMRKTPRHLERYWLCDPCAEVWTLVHDRNRGIALAPLPSPRHGATVAIKAAYGEIA